MAGERFYRKLAILAKLETTEGTDSVPTGAADAMQARDVRVTPIDGEDVSRALMLPHMGNQGVEFAGTYGRLEFAVEFAPSGTAGDAPAYGPLLRMCGFSETITASTKVDYDPVSDGFESGSIYFNQDGVRHVLLGARGSFTMSMSPKQIPYLRFTFMGMLGTITDQALPTIDLASFKRPIVVSDAMTTFSLLSHSAVLESFTIDMGQRVEARHLIGSETILITDRNVSGSCVVEARNLATKNWFQASLDRDQGALSMVHGTTAGKIVEITGPKVELGRPDQGETQGIVNYTLPLSFVPTDAGNDEIRLTVR